MMGSARKGKVAKEEDVAIMDEGIWEGGFARRQGKL